MERKSSDNLERRKLAVRQQIEDAFAQTPYPGDDNIAEPTYDDEGTAAYFRGQTWRGHTAKALRYYESALTSFTLDAFRYYLPAYMIATLDDPEEADVIPDGIKRRFASQFDPMDVVIPERSFACFSPDEREAIAAFIRYLADEDAERWRPPLSQCVTPEFALAELREIEEETVKILNILGVEDSREDLKCVRIQQEIGRKR